MRWHSSIGREFLDEVIATPLLLLTIISPSPIHRQRGPLLTVSITHQHHQHSSIIIIIITFFIILHLICFIKKKPRKSESVGW